MIRYVCPLITVQDMPTAVRFYTELLEQKIRFDFGQNVTFEGDFALHLESHFLGLLGDTPPHPITRRAHNGELYFETDDLEALVQRLEAAQVELLHPLREQPWGQQVLRVYDPDGHIVEVGETMEAVVWRFHQQGLSPEALSARTSMPLPFVHQVLQQHGIHRV